MKNYELMKQLSGMPAGAEVKIGTVIAVEALKDDLIVQDNEEGTFYNLAGEIGDVESGKEEIHIYVKME